MPDKHEVGGSSPLGPTSRTKQDKNPYKERKRLFSSEARDKLIYGGSSPLGPTRRTKFAKMLIENRISI